MTHRILAALAVGGFLALLPACASDGAYVGGGVGYGYYSGYYDNFYGPVRYGYWGPDNYFYYSRVIRGPYVRDDGRHFRREHWGQGRHFRMRGMMQHG